MTTTKTITSRQLNALVYLKANRTGLTAPQLRDNLGLERGTYGTQQTHALLRNFTDKGWVEREEMSAKVAAKNRVGTTGRVPTTRFKITAEGKAALKAAA